MGPHVPRRRLTLAGSMCRIRFPRVPLKRSPSRLLGRLTVRMTFCMGPHVPRRRFSFARRECGVRFSKVPLFGGACSKVGEDALQATWKDSISFASTIKVRSPNGLKALRYERRDCRSDSCPNHYGPVGQRFKPSHFLCEDPSSNLGGTTMFV